MFERLITFLAPHTCLCCEREGSLLCGGCQYQILESTISCCHECNKVINRGLWCQNCCLKTWCDEAWSVGLYQAPLSKIIKNYKFEGQRAAAQPLVDLLVETIPNLPPETIIVPIPTISRHVRQRGFDHTHLIARALAKKRNLPVVKVLERRTSSVQVGASRKIRLDQARRAFGLVKPLENKPYLLIDDVITTGATIKAAARLLKQHGARQVFAAVVANEPRHLLKSPKSVLQ